MNHFKLTIVSLAACLLVLATPFHATAVDMPTVKQTSVQWKTISGIYPLIDMRFIAPHRLLLTQEINVSKLAQTPTLVNTRSGAEVWRYQPEGWELDHCTLVAAFSDLVVISESNPRNGLTTLAAISSETGKQLWFVQYNNKKRSFQFLPVPAEGVILVVELEKKKATLRGLELKSGQEKWNQTIKIQKGGHPTQPLTTPQGIWNFYGHTSRIDPADGKTLWQRKDIVPDNLSPPAKLQNNKLHLVDKEKTLHILDPVTGDSILTAPLDGKARYTNIYPDDKHLYLRGRDADGAWFLAQHDGQSGKSIWKYSSTQATVSNLIEEDNRLYVATAAKVLCLDSTTGREIFSASATLTGQSFPVRLRKYGNTVVYIGELVIAGFDAKTGKTVYKAGMTPVSQEMHLDAVDNWMSVLQNRIGKLSKAIWFSGAGALGDAFGAMSVNSQNLSNSYSNKASNYRLRAGRSYNPSSSSDSWKSASSQAQSQMNSTFAMIEAQLSFFFTMEGMKNAMLSRSIARDQKEVNRLHRIRKRILAACSASESDDYVWRTHVEGDWIGLNLVHLPTGRTTFTPYSPFIKKEFVQYTNYNEYTLWNLVDVETGLVYHKAMRIGGANLQKNNKPGMSNYTIRLVAEKVKMK